jgi:hypothetical protein
MANVQMLDEAISTLASKAQEFSSIADIYTQLNLLEQKLNDEIHEAQKSFRESSSNLKKVENNIMEFTDDARKQVYNISDRIASNHDSLKGLLESQSLALKDTINLRISEMKSDVKNEMASTIENKIMPAIQTLRSDIIAKEEQTQKLVKIAIGIALLSMITSGLAAIRLLS